MTTAATRFLFLFVIGILCAAKPVVAWDKNAFRKESAALVSELRKWPEPQGRCTLGAQLSKSQIVVRTFGNSVFMLGDQLISVNGNSLEVAGADLTNILRSIAPTSIVPVTIIRNGAPKTIEVVCSDYRPTYDRMLRGLEAAANGKFDDCMVLLDGVDGISTFEANVRGNCALFSRRAKQLNLAQISFDINRMAIEDAFWDPSTRPGTIDRLRSGEGFITQSLGTGKFQELIDLTKKWPGDNTAFEATSPKWNELRASAEIELRRRLIDPDSAKIEWPRGFLLGSWKPLLSKRYDGYWTCGVINARNRMGGYTGSTSFVVVLSKNGIVEYTEIGGVTANDILSTQCAKSINLLPAPQFDPVTVQSPVDNNVRNSVADDLQKLLNLRDSGALSSQEYEAAKKKLLGI